MIVRLIGAVLVIISSSAMGFSVAHCQRKEELALKQLIHGLEFMACELEYKMIALPDLFENTAKQVSGHIHLLFLRMHQLLTQQTFANVDACMNRALSESPGIPQSVRANLQMLGSGLGRFDLQGQLSGIHSVTELCRRDLLGLQNNQEVRFRTYRTLGICAGIALVILFI